MDFLLHLVIGTILILLVAKLIPGIEITNWISAVAGALVLGALNAVIRPVFTFLTYPVTVITLGLSLFVVNALMLRLAAALVPGFMIKGCLPALLGAVLLSVLNLLAAQLLFG